MSLFAPTIEVSGTASIYKDSQHIGPVCVYKRMNMRYQVPSVSARLCDMLFSTLTIEVSGTIQHLQGAIDCSNRGIELLFADRDIAIDKLFVTR